MAALLSGLLAAIGGPQKILKTVGGFVGDVIQGIQKGKSFGSIITGAGSKAVKTLLDIKNDKPLLSVAPKIIAQKVIQEITKKPASLADARPIIIPESGIKRSAFADVAQLPREQQLDKFPLPEPLKQLRPTLRADTFDRGDKRGLARSRTSFSQNQVIPSSFTADQLALITKLLEKKPRKRRKKKKKKKKKDGRRKPVNGRRKPVNGRRKPVNGRRKK